MLPGVKVAGMTCHLDRGVVVWWDEQIVLMHLSIIGTNGSSEHIPRRRKCSFRAWEVKFRLLGRRLKPRTSAARSTHRSSWKGGD